MSRTDKDRPDWVIRHVEGMPIDHDHRKGECVIETLEYARVHNAGGYRTGWRHNCKKRVAYEYYCTKDEPFRTSHYRWSHGRSWKPSGRDVCWGEWEEPAQYVGRYYPRNVNGFIMRTKSNGCLGPHRRWVTREEIHCECDDWPKVPTCDPASYGEEIGHRYWTAYGCRNVPKTERCHVEYHGPERQRERDAIKVWVKSYNAGDDLDDWDYENRQGRHSVQWHMF